MDESKLFIWARTAKVRAINLTLPYYPEEEDEGENLGTVAYRGKPLCDDEDALDCMKD